MLNCASTVGFPTVLYARIFLYFYVEGSFDKKKNNLMSTLNGDKGVKSYLLYACNPTW